LESMKSRFFAGSSSDSDKNESDQDSDNDNQITQRQAGGRFGATFQESDSDSGDERRVVKSQKDRAWDTIKEANVKIYDALKINDWSRVQDEYNIVNTKVEKSKMLTIQYGLPPFYIKMLVDLEDAVQAVKKDKEAIKKMKPAISKSFQQIRLQLKKHNELPEYKDKVEDCRQHPEKYKEVVVEEEEDDAVEEPEDEDEESDEEDEVVVPKAKAVKKVANDDWEDESYKSSDNEVESEEGEGEKLLKGRAKWLKKGTDVVTNDARKKKREANRLLQQQAVGGTAWRKKEIGSSSSGVRADRRVASWHVQDVMTEEELEKKVAELVASRGRKSTDHRVILRQLEVLTKAARILGPRKEIPVLAYLISAMFDSNRLIDEFMELQQWRTCHRSLTRILKLLEQNKHLVLGSVSSDTVGGEDLVDSESSQLNGANDKKHSSIVKIVGSVDTFILRLEDEYVKSLQQINPHTQEYVVRLSDEASLVELAESIRAYDLKVGDMQAAAAVSLLVIEHSYYKHDSHAAAVQKSHAFNKVWGRHADLHPASLGKLTASLVQQDPTVSHPAAFLGSPTVVVPAVNTSQHIEELSSFIFKHGKERQKTRALLCSVYHHALHDRYHTARDLFLISHVHDFIDKADVKTQILYNRAVVTLGLCAFRLGLFQKAHDCLSGICSGRVKELLAQGQQLKWGDKDPEQEKLERRRQMPYHMHINPDLLECCHLTCAMILELPHLARSPASSLTTQQHVISKQFRKFLAGYNKQVFTGPPENTKEHVMVATNSLLRGDWQKAVDCLVNLEVWNYIPNEGGESVKKLLQTRLKEEAVRTYLLIHAEHYDSVNLHHICEMFAMEPAVTRRIVSKMIFNRELAAAWDNPPHILVMYRAEHTPLTQLAQGTTDRLSQLVESNERLLDPLMGVYGFRDDWSGGGGTGAGQKLAGGGVRFKGAASLPMVRSGSRPMVAGGRQRDGGGRDAKGAGGGLGRHKLGGGVGGVSGAGRYSGMQSKPVWSSGGGTQPEGGVGKYQPPSQGPSTTRG